MYPDGEKIGTDGEKIGTDGDEKQVIYFTWPYYILNSYSYSSMKSDLSCCASPEIVSAMNTFLIQT